MQLNMIPRWHLLAMLALAWLLAACAIQPIQPQAPAPSLETPAVDGMRQLLARQLHVDPASVEIVSVEAVEWPDACLGAANPGEVCAQVVTPGYKMTLRVAGQEYTYHTDGGAYWSRLVAAPEPRTGETIIAWTGTADNGSCQEATMGADGVAFGLCGGPKLGGQFATAARPAVLAELAARYAPFEAETEFGQVTFTGSGATAASPDERRMIARWAQMATLEAGAGQSMAGLAWQGPAEMGSPDTSKCATLQMGGSQVVLGACDGTAQTLPMDERLAAEWADIQDRFAPFVYETPTETLVFEGMGLTGDGVWQPALLAWARLRHAELTSGRVSAAANTAMSWHLGQMMDRKNACAHLTVLAYGYAQAETILCEGLDVTESVGGWLETSEMKHLDRWLYARAGLYQDQNYIAGEGSQPMSEAEIAEAEQWARDVWTRLTGIQAPMPPAQPTPAPEAQLTACPPATADTVLYIDEANGYCLLHPADYVAEATTPNDVSVVRGSLMNHTDPRVSITVEDAAGRTLKQVADQLEADSVIPGMTAERGSITVDGVEAVMLDNLPGQDLNRRVALIHNGRLYSFTFTPFGVEGIPSEAFYQGILDSFRFLEQPVPTPTPDPASVEVLPTDVPYVMALTNVNIRSGPGTNYAILGKVFAGQTAQVTGVTADGGWWRVICPDGAVGNCFVVADPELTAP